MGINTNTQRFKEELVSLINDSKLPACVLEMILDNALAVIRVKVHEAILKEKEEQNE